MLLDQEEFQFTPIPPKRKKEEEKEEEKILALPAQEEGQFQFTPIPKKGAPEVEEEKKPSIFEKAKGLAEKFIPYIPGIGEAFQRGQQAKIEREKRAKMPETPTIGPLSEEEYAKRRYIPETPRYYPKAEELEYGQFEKLIDIPGQFLTQFAKMFSWGLPEFVPGEEPAPKSEAAEVTGALGHLVGLAGGGAGGAAKYAPFKVSAKIAQRIWKKPAKTVVGKFVQNVLKNANTLGLALGATEWEGGDAKEILKNKAEAFASGEAIGAFFGGMQFVHFAKAHPIMSFAIRYGMGSALLDIAENKSPLDERSLFTKAYEYGLNAYFLQHGVSPKEYDAASKSLLQEIKRFNKEAKQDGLDIQLPESLDHIRKIVGEPGAWIQPGEKVPRRITAPATRYATEKTVLPEEMTEAERIKVEYDQAMGRSQVINVKPKEDGSVDITIRQPTTAPESPKELAMGSFLAARQNYPRILYKSIEDSRIVKEGVVTPKELVDYVEARGKEVIEKPSVIPGPKEKKAPAKKAPGGFKDPLWQAIADAGGVAPDKDFSRNYLVKDLGIPARLVKKSGKPMDQLAASLSETMPKIEDSRDLEQQLLDRKKGKAPTEKEREEGLEEYFERMAEEQAEEKLEAPEEKTEKPTPPKEEEKRLYRISPELRKLEKALKEGKLSGEELTEEQKKMLEERGAYEFKPAPEEKPLPEVDQEVLEGRKKTRLVKVSLTSPTGKAHDLGELPEAMASKIKEYADKFEVSDKLKMGTPKEKEWTEYLPPKEIERFMQEMIRDAKKKPKEEWAEWEKGADEEYQKLYSGLPPPEFVRSVGSRILSKLQTEPQFKAIGAPDTGLQAKLYHPTRNAELERGERYIKDLMKTGKRFGLSDEDYQELTFVASKPGKFYVFPPEKRGRFSKRGEKDTPYRIVRRFFDEYEKRLIDLGVIEEGWPESHLRRLKEERIHVQAALKRLQKVGVRRKKLSNRLKDIDAAIEFINKSKPQYVHIPRMWFEMIYDRNPRTAPRIITELFKQRKTLDIEKLANYLTKTKIRDLIPKDEWDLYKAKDLDRTLLEPKDMDIRRIMMAYAHKAGHKIGLKKIFSAAEKEGLLRDEDVAPRSWKQMPSWIYPTLKGKRAHPVFADYFETNFVRQGFMPPKLGGVLGTIKLMQFYNPLFLPMYDMVQAWWSGSVRSYRTPNSVLKAFRSMRKADKHYWDMHEWGGFSTPYTPSFETYMKRADQILKSDNFMKRVVKKVANPYEWYKTSWKTAWTGDHFIRLITYHHYVSKGYTPREAAQLTAKLHADYASIPPSTRKWLNKIFFTPSFKISMMAAQAEMVKSAGKLLIKGRKAGGTEKAMAKSLVGLTSGMLMREAIMHALGFKTDQYGLKYYKEIEDEDGKKRELVLHVATPDNVYLRFFHRFKTVLPIFGKEEKKLEGFINRAKWELHPLWQVGMELYSNKSVSLAPIYNPLDKPEKIIKDSLEYTARRLIRATELLPGKKESLQRRDAYNALVKDLDKIGVVLSFFTLPYTRSTKEKRLLYEINQLKSQFKYMKREKPAKTPEEAERRLERFRDLLEKMRERLREEREENE